MQESALSRDLIWDGENIALDLDTSSTRAAYTHNPQLHGELVSQRRSGATAFHHGVYPERSRRDALGSTRSLTNSGQTVTDTRDYKAFGATNGSSGSSVNPFWWVGRLGYYHQPDSADYWLRARVYRPHLGRFLRRDPVRQPNLYLYAANSPVANVDPSGMQRSVAVGGPTAQPFPIYQCENQADFCCELPWAFGPPRQFLFPTYTADKQVWHTDIRCICGWAPSDCPTAGTGRPAGRERATLEGFCGGIAHHITVQWQGGEVVSASPEHRKYVLGKCIKPREGQICREPGEPRGDRCGPTIDSALSQTLWNIMSAFAAASPNQQKKGCAALVVIPWAFNAIDIGELHGGGTGSPNCPTPGHCEDTVQVHGLCHLAASVNYVAGGLAAMLCAIPWFIWAELVRGYAGTRGPAYRDAALMWAHVGYSWPTNWPDRTYMVRGECIRCPETSDQAAFTVQWEGIGTINP